MEKVNVIRYVRPVVNGQVHNMGGYTFVFEMNYENRTVDIMVSRCSDKDNFNKKLGVKNAKFVRSLNLDGFREYADIYGGFVKAYLFGVLEYESLFHKYAMNNIELQLVKKIHKWVDWVE